MDLHCYDHRDPAELVRGLAQLYPMTEPAAYLVVVEDPPGLQRIVHCRRMDAPAILDDHRQASEELRERLEALAIPWPDRSSARPGPRHAATVVVVGPGLSVATANEGRWAMAWRYANVMAPVFVHGLIVVTQHGWYDLETHWGGFSPALRPSRRGEPRRLRSV